MIETLVDILEFPRREIKLHRPARKTARSTGSGRLVIDTGIYFKRWTRAETIAYMTDRTGLGRDEVSFGSSARISALLMLETLAQERQPKPIARAVSKLACAA